MNVPLILLLFVQVVLDVVGAPAYIPRLALILPFLLKSRPTPVLPAYIIGTKPSQVLTDLRGWTQSNQNILCIRLWLMRLWLPHMSTKDSLILLLDTAIHRHPICLILGKHTPQNRNLALVSIPTHIIPREILYTSLRIYNINITFQMDIIKGFSSSRTIFLLTLSSMWVQNIMTSEHFEKTTFSSDNDDWAFIMISFYGHYR